MQETSLQKVERLYRFLKDYAELRSPIKRHIGEQPWCFWLRELPSHPSIEFINQARADFVIRIRRPEITEPQTPPTDLEEWIEQGWNNPFQPPKVRLSLNKSLQENEAVTLMFEDDPARVEAWQNWQRVWHAWAEAEKPARDALHLYNRMFELRGRLEREGERFELLLGDGILSWHSPEGKIHHPILLQKVQLDFDPSVPEFRIVESDKDVEFYSAVLRSVPELEAKSVAHIRKTLDEGDYHPLDDTETTGFLRYVVQQLSSKGTYQDKVTPQPISNYPILSRDRVLFLRERTQGYTKAIEDILESLPANLTGPLLRIVGVESNESEIEKEAELPFQTLLPGEEPEEILFSKPWNQEQLQIAERLENHSGVVVQGPPGTGKTHTIANLIGHLLAQGSSVLVTAHTTKALQVVREQVVEELRPLCVSVLDNDQENKKQLEDSVEKIAQQLSNSNIKLLELESSKLDFERKKMLSEIRETRQKLLEARGYEYQEIVVAGKGYNPSEAARKVRADIGIHDWIPGEVRSGEPLSLSREELRELYNTNAAIRPEDEAELQLELPNPSSLLTPQAFSNLLARLEELEANPIQSRDELWDASSETSIKPELEDIVEKFAQAVQPLIQRENWELEAIRAGQQGGAHRESWDKLLEQIKQIVELAAHAQEKIIEHSPILSSQMPLEKQQQIAGEIASHLSSGGNLGALVLLTKGDWKNLIKEVGISSGKPQKVEHFKAIETLARLQIARLELVKRWDYLIANRGGLKLSGNEPEQSAIQYTGIIENHLAFSQKIEAYRQNLKQAGFRWEQFLAEEPPNPAPQGELMQMSNAVSSRLPSIVQAKIRQACRILLRNDLERLSETLTLAPPQSRLVQRLSRAVVERDFSGYTEAFSALVELVSLRPKLNKRGDLLKHLKRVAPDWAQEIDRRIGEHGKAELPGDPEIAWLHKQLSSELDRRAQVSPQLLQDHITEMTGRLHRITAQLIEQRSWLHQLRRTNPPQQQALFGWLNTIRKIGKGTGKRAPQLRRDAKRLMSECRTAVPVWIMPLSRVVEQFDPRSTQFDVVIVDEASQSDLMGLVAFKLAKKVIVVGDHEQVSPDAVGQETSRIEQLIGEHLSGIPNSHLYDGKTSIYDIARQSFGGMISLLEHFRCVPEIIQFSNTLSYQGRIKPLRESGGVALKPHVIAHRVNGIRGESDKINLPEAKEIAALITAATELPEYKDPV